MHSCIFYRGDTGFLSQVEIDTAHFKGNFPESCELHAVHSVSDDLIHYPEANWVPILPRTKLGPHRQHCSQLLNVEGKPYTHVRLTIHPDGGIKRIRLLGRRLTTSQSPSQVTLSQDTKDDIADLSEAKPSPRLTETRVGPIIPALPLTRRSI